jgi:hypothetical protein
MLPDAWERRLVDMNFQRLKPSDIEWADVVFCCAMLMQKDSLRRVVALCKARGKRVAIGGPYVTTSAGDVSRAPHLALKRLLCLDNNADSRHLLISIPFDYKVIPASAIAALGPTIA